MHNWRLLLLAFLAVLQPIASFSERNLVDGREQCCDRNSLLRDSRLSYGSFRHNKLSEDRRLSRTDIREDRRYEVRTENAVLTRPSAERRLVELQVERETRRLSPDLVTRSARTESRRERIVENRREIPNESRVRNAYRLSSRDINRDMRSGDVAQNMRFSQNTDVRQQDRINREFSSFEGASHYNRNARNINSERKFRVSMDSRRETRDNTQARRMQEARQTREVLQRTRLDVARDDISRAGVERRIVSKRVDERRARSESRLQRDNNREIRSQDRVREVVQERSSFLRTNSVDRTRDARDESRAQQDVRNQRNNSGREVVSRIDERRLQRDQDRTSSDRMSVRSDLRERSAETLRNIPVSTDRFRTVEKRDTRRDSRTDGSRDQIRRDRAVSETRRVSRKLTDRDISRVRIEVTERRDQQMMDRRDVIGSRPQLRDSRREVRDSRREVRDSRHEVRDLRRDFRESRRDVREESRVERREVRDSNPQARVSSRQFRDSRYQVRDSNHQVRDSVPQIRESRRDVHGSRRDIRESKLAVPDSRREVRDSRREVRESRREVRDSRPEVRDSRSELRDSRREVRDSRREVRDSRREVRDSRPELRDSRREVRDSRLEIRHTRIQSTEARKRDVSSSRTEYRIIKNTERERELTDARLRTNARSIARENIASVREKTQPDETTMMNWQNVFYTLQGIYLCGVLMQILSQKDSDKTPRIFSWLATPRNLIKVD